MTPKNPLVSLAFLVPFVVDFSFIKKNQWNLRQKRNRQGRQERKEKDETLLKIKTPQFTFHSTSPKRSLINP
jgi:hypothetical protein